MLGARLPVLISSSMSLNCRSSDYLLFRLLTADF